jgi:hypothetical protein
MYMRFRCDTLGAEIRFTFSRVHSGQTDERVRLVRGTVLWADNPTAQVTLERAVAAVLARVALPRRRVNTERTLENITTVMAQETGDTSWRCVNRYRVLRRRVVRRRPRFNAYGMPSVGRRHPIHSYSYKPAPRFRMGGTDAADTRTFFGIELEIDQTDGRLDASEVPDLAHPLFYCKHDGSLRYGVEMVSHPGSLAWWNEQRGNVDALLTRLSRMGWRSHETRTCGMHIHVSSEAFDGSMHVYRFLHLVYRYPEMALLVSQRQRAQLNQWATLSYKSKPSLKRKAQLALKAHEGWRAESGGHYDGVNGTGHTYELRIFNGTLNPKRFYKNLQYAAAALAFTAETTNLRRVNAAEFVAWVNARSEQYPDLAAFFAEHSDHRALATKRAA